MATRTIVISRALGMPMIFPIPMMRREGSVIGTDIPFVMMYTSPRRMVIVARVAMNEGIFPLANISPLKTPQSAPTTPATGNASMPSRGPRTAVAADPMPMIDPTARSMLPARMTNVSPMAAISSTDACTRISRRFSARRKRPLPIEKPTRTPTRASR